MRKKKQKHEKEDVKFGFSVILDAGTKMPPIMVVSPSIAMAKIAANALCGASPATAEVKAVGFIVMDNGEMATRIENEERGICTAPKKRKRKLKQKVKAKADKEKASK